MQSAATPNELLPISLYSVEPTVNNDSISPAKDANKDVRKDNVTNGHREYIKLTYLHAAPNEAYTHDFQILYGRTYIPMNLYASSNINMNLYYTHVCACARL